jgi:1-aminocyclopropane-1-carboxylate deaminase/D-cysteine desulfhydrase-like pyridoxal-dependent ACC family enzyme
VELFVKRDDLMHPIISGNKLYKLKYSIAKAKNEEYGGILTFGGAYSNHIAATAAYCKEEGIQSVGIIRGESTQPLNPTLSYSKSCGMTLSFIDRTTYRSKDDPGYLEKLKEDFNNPLIIPEGGANLEGITGAQEIIGAQCDEFDIIALAVGTGTTLAGILKALSPHQKVIGFPVHKHATVFEDVIQIDSELQGYRQNQYSIEGGYHFGGYAKWNDALIQFMRSTYDEGGLKTDPIYTSKALYGIIDMIQKGSFEIGTKILFIHTGGLQGIGGFEQRHGFTIYAS